MGAIAAGYYAAYEPQPMAAVPMAAVPMTPLGSQPLDAYALPAQPTHGYSASTPGECEQGPAAQHWCGHSRAGSSSDGRVSPHWQGCGGARAVRRPPHCAYNTCIAEPPPPFHLAAPMPMSPYYAQQSGPSGAIYGTL